METNNHLPGIMIFLSSVIIVLCLALLLKQNQQPKNKLIIQERTIIVPRNDKGIGYANFRGC
jgi:hypothetical protein